MTATANLQKIANFYLKLPKYICVAHSNQVKIFHRIILDYQYRKDHFFVFLIKIKAYAIIRNVNFS